MPLQYQAFNFCRLATVFITACFITGFSVNASEFDESGLFKPEDKSSSGDAGFYIGAGISRAYGEYEDDIGSVDIDFDDAENAFHARAGFMLTNWIGIEAGYYNFDEYEELANSLIEDTGLTGQADAELDLSAYTAALVFNVPIYFFDFYIKGGVAYLDIDARAEILGRTFSESEGRTEPFAVAGGELDFGVINLYTEYTRVIGVDDVEVDLISGGIKLEF